MMKHVFYHDENALMRYLLHFLSPKNIFLSDAS